MSRSYRRISAAQPGLIARKKLSLLGDQPYKRDQVSNLGVSFERWPQVLNQRVAVARKDQLARGFKLERFGDNFPLCGFDF